MPEPRSLSDPKFGFPKHAIAQLSKHNIDAPRQLVALCDTEPTAVSELTGTNAAALRGAIVRHLPPEAISTAIMRSPLPPLTGALSPKLETGSAVNKSNGLNRLTTRLNTLPPLPDRILLEPHLPPPFSQGEAPTCVGQSIAGLRSYFANTAMSGEFIYQVAKRNDGMPGMPGTYLRNGMEAAYAVGTVPSQRYTFQDYLENNPIDGLFANAARARLRGYADLLEERLEPALIPKLFHAILAGALTPGLGPRPIPISTPVFGSMLTDYARDTGIFHIPLPTEKSRGGHAWLISGLILDSNPKAPMGRSYWILRNSWSAGWARSSPVYAGSALVPYRFFENREWLYEAYLGLAEAAPVPPFQ